MDIEFKMGYLELDILGTRPIGTQDPGPGTRDPGPGTWDLGPGTPLQGTQTWGPGPEDPDLLSDQPLQGPNHTCSTDV